MAWADWDEDEGWDGGGESRHGGSISRVERALAALLWAVLALCAVAAGVVLALEVLDSIAMR